jgi:hypothetical protein
MPGTPSEVNLLLGPLVLWLLILTATLTTNWLTGWLERIPLPRGAKGRSRPRIVKWRSTS